jgi:type II secretion system protein L
MAKKILGLDIKPNGVSAILVTGSMKGNQIEAHAYIPYAGQISDPQTMENSIGEAITAISETMDLSGSICVASIPPDRIMYRHIQVPFKDEKKIGQILPFELEPLLPVPPEDIILTFQSFQLSDHRDRTELITASVEQSTLSSYLNILESHGIDPEIVTAGGYALAQYMFGLPDMPENWILLDIGSHNGSICIVMSGQICFLRSFPLNLSDAAAIPSICSSVEHTLSAFEDTFEMDVRFDCLFLSDNFLLDDSFYGEAERILGIPVKRLNLLNHPHVPIGQRPDSTVEQNRFDGALALALLDVSGIKGFNFRQGPFAYKKQWVENKKNLMTSGIILAFVMILAFFNVYIDIRGMEKQVARLDGEIRALFQTAFPDDRRIVDPRQQMQMKLKEIRKQSINAGNIKGSIRMVDMLNAISTHVPKETDVEFTQMLMGADNILLSGNTDTFNSVDSIKQHLEQEQSFKRVTISSANTNRTGNRITFKLKIDL